MGVGADGGSPGAGKAEAKKAGGSPTVIKLKRPITYGEGAGAQTLEEINLEALQNLTGADVLFCRQEAARKTGGPIFYGLADDHYRLEVLAKASGVAPEVLVKMWAPDFEEVDQAVKLFLTGSG